MTNSRGGMLLIVMLGLILALATPLTALAEAGQATEAAQTGRIQVDYGFAWVRSGPGTQYRAVGKLAQGATVSILASVTGQAVQPGRPLWYKIGAGRYVYSGLVRLGGQAGGEKWIEVILSQQKLIAWEGSQAVLISIVSTGKPATPTVKGAFRIYSKYRYKNMSGPGYYLPNVPHTMFFYQGYAIHGTYWHNNFGRVMSRGCVNVNLKDAAWLFDWAPVGTKVVVHD